MHLSLHSPRIVFNPAVSLLIPNVGSQRPACFSGYRSWRGTGFQSPSAQRFENVPAKAEPLPSSWEIEETWDSDEAALVAEDELDDWFEDDGSGGDIQEAIAVALAALLLAGFVNVTWRLLVVCVAVASTAFKYSVVALLLLIFIVFAV